jgi:hypothetical protein
LAAVGLVVVIVVVAVSSRGGDDPGGLAISPDPTTTRATRTAEPTSDPTVEPTQTAAPALVPRRRLTIEILNAAGRTGLAGRTEGRLNERGYVRTEVGNAQASARTTIFFRGALRREAERLLQDFPELGRVRQARTATPGSAQITIILGENYAEPD